MISTISLVRVQPSLRSRLFTWVLTVTTSTQRMAAISLSFCRSNSSRTKSRSAPVIWDTVLMKNSRLRSELRRREYSFEQQVLSLAIQHGMAVVGTADAEQQLLIWTALDDVVYRPGPPWR